MNPITSKNTTVDLAGRVFSLIRIDTSLLSISPCVSHSASLLFCLTSDTTASQACFCTSLCCSR